MATNSMSNHISLTVVNLCGRCPFCGYLPTVLDINLEATSNNSSLLNAKWNVPHRLCLQRTVAKGSQDLGLPPPYL